jgi:hypothetical protein
MILPIFQQVIPDHVIPHEEATMNAKSNQPTADDGEQELRGPELGSPHDHLTAARKHNPDLQLRVDGEPDTLYDDGLDIDGDGDTLAGTDGLSPKGIKG